MWKLYGVALVFLDYDPIDQNQINYRLSALVFPANAFLNSLMKMDMFRNVVMDKMKLIIGDVQHSAQTFASGERRPLQDYEKFQTDPVLKKQLQEFEEVVKNSGYGQKVWPLPTPKSSLRAVKIWNPLHEANSSSSANLDAQNSPLLHPAAQNNSQDALPPMILLPKP
jgi:hypothetical protein